MEMSSIHAGSASLNQYLNAAFARESAWFSSIYLSQVSPGSIPYINNYFAFTA